MNGAIVEDSTLVNLPGLEIKENLTNVEKIILALTHG